MSKRLLALAALLCMFVSPLTLAGEYDDALQSFRAAKQTGQFFDNAYGYVVFPTIGKGGFGIGGSHGSGRVYAKGM